MPRDSYCSGMPPKVNRRALAWVNKTHPTWNAELADDSIKFDSPCNDVRHARAVIQRQLLVAARELGIYAETA